MSYWNEQSKFGPAKSVDRWRLVLADFRLLTLCLLVFLPGPKCWSQEEFEDVRTGSEEQSKPQSQEQLNVNWLYGAYIPKEAPLVALTGHQREKLFVRQTFTTPGIYVRSSFLPLIDQASGTHALSFEALHQNVPELPPHNLWHFSTSALAQTIPATKRPRPDYVRKSSVPFIDFDDFEGWTLRSLYSCAATFPATLI